MIRAPSASCVGRPDARTTSTAATARLPPIAVAAGEAGAGASNSVRTGCGTKSSTVWRLYHGRVRRAESGWRPGTSHRGGRRGEDGGRLRFAKITRKSGYVSKNTRYCVRPKLQALHLVCFHLTGRAATAHISPSLQFSYDENLPASRLVASARHSAVVGRFGRGSRVTSVGESAEYGTPVIRRQRCLGEAVGRGAGLRAAARGNNRLIEEQRA